MEPPLVETCGIDSPKQGMTPESGSYVPPDTPATALMSAMALSAWRVAKSLLTFRDQINAAAPNRSKASDGTIGDAAHASRASDHNPWVKDGTMGIVTAIDITHDVGGGCNCFTITEQLRLSRDKRIKYVIFNGRLFSSYASGGVPAWTWRNYTGTNQHRSHLHLSVQPTKALYDSTTPWSIGTEGGTMESIPTKDWQELLNEAKWTSNDGKPIVVDGKWGAKTRQATLKFMKRAKAARTKANVQNIIANTKLTPPE